MTQTYTLGACARRGTYKKKPYALLRTCNLTQLQLTDSYPLWKPKNKLHVHVAAEHTAHVRNLSAESDRAETELIC